MPTGGIKNFGATGNCPMLTEALVQEYIRQRAALLSAFPELAEDVEALADTLEGITEAPDVIARFVREAREDEALAGSLAIMLREMSDRKQRFAARADRRREAAMKLMNACAIRKIEMPDFTASIRAVPPKVEIEDEAALPESLCKVVRSPDRTAIKDALVNGPVAGARLSNGSETLTVRTR